MYIHLCEVFNIKASHFHRGPQQTSVLATRWCECDNNSDPHTELVWLSSHTKCFQFYPGYFSFILSSFLHPQSPARPRQMWRVCSLLWSAGLGPGLSFWVVFFIFISSSYFNLLHCLILDSPRSVASVSPLYFGGCCSVSVFSLTFSWVIISYPQLCSNLLPLPRYPSYIMSWLCVSLSS